VEMVGRSDEAGWRPSGRDFVGGCHRQDQGLPGGHVAVGLVRLGSGADRGVEFGPFLRLALGLEEMADGAKATR